MSYDTSIVLRKTLWVTHADSLKKLSAGTSQCEWKNK
jgi:hypothetical protein